MTIEQAADELNVGVHQIRAMLGRGELRGFQIGGRGLWRICTSDLEDFIANAYDRTASLANTCKKDSSPEA